MQRLSALVLLFAGLNGFAQTAIQFNHYTVDQGLSDQLINDVYQDENGFTWVATGHGLNRFDGVQFKNFFNTGKTYDIPDNNVMIIRKWKDHLLVIATGNGIGILDPRTGKCRTILIPSEKEISHITNYIPFLKITSKNEIIAGGSTGIYVFNEQLQLIARIEAGYSAKDIGRKRFLFCNSVNVISNGDALIGTTNGMLFYDHQKKLFFPLSQHTNPLYREIGSHLMEGYHSINTDTHDRLFCIDYYKPKSQISVFDLRSGKKTVSPMTTDEICWSSLIAFHNDSLFSVNSCTGGFFLFTHDTATLAVKPISEKLLGSWYANKLMLDREKRWWACTGNGLLSQSLVKQQFTNTEILGYLENESTFEGVKVIYRYKGKLYVGLETIYGGILVFDENNRMIRRIDLASLDRGCNMIWNIDKWNGDSLIIGTQSGVVLLNTNNYHFSRVGYGGWPAAANENPVTANYLDKQGTRWIGLGQTNGVLAYYTATKTWKHFSPNEKDPQFKIRYPTYITEDQAGNVWMMKEMEGGITRWNYQQQRFDTVIRTFGENENDFYSLTSDEDGNLWIGLLTHGIIQWHPQKNQFRRYSQFNTVRTLFTGVPGQLWMLNRQSVSVMNLRTGATSSFNRANGMPGHSTTSFKFYFDTLTQALMLGFANSFTRFDPHDVFKKEQSKKIFITEINVLNDTLQTDPGKPVRLKYRQNDLAIHFSAIDYENGQQNNYEYRLFENENSPWINIGQQQTINLNNLPSGKYTFQVRLSSSNTDRQIASTSIIITPPFYQTTWFYLVCALVLCAAIYLLYRFRIRQLLQIQQVRNRISSDLHDDIGARLTNIQLLSALSEQRLKEPKEASLYLRRIVNEVQTSGEALDDIVWSINSKNDSGDELAARMRRYAAEIFEGDHIVCNMNVNENIGGIKLRMEKRRDLYLVFKESLNNILKHAHATVITIEMHRRDNNVVLAISDNGKGFNVNEPTGRNGLKNMKKRIEKWKGKVVVESTIGAGTSLHVTLPVSEPSLKRTILKRLHLS